MDTKLVSIIIPVYNVEAYLQRSFEALKQQTYSNIEFIIVEDHSTDNSFAICQKVAHEDHRFKVFRTPKNCGAGLARQFGIEHSRGEIIGFADGDDVMMPNFVEELLAVMERTNADIVCSQYYFWYENGKIVSPWAVTNEEFIVDSKEGIRRMVYYDHIGTELWNKLYRREIILSKPMFSCHYEDAFVLIDYFSVAKTICVYCMPLYYYFQRADSQMNLDYSPEKEFYHFKLASCQTLALRKLGYKDRSLSRKTLRSGIRLMKHCAILSGFKHRYHGSICEIESLARPLLKHLTKELRHYLRFPDKFEARLIVYVPSLYKVLYVFLIRMFNQKKIKQTLGRYTISSAKILNKNI